MKNMKNTFLNITNHPSSGWSDEQKKAAITYGNYTDSEGDLLNKEFGNEIVDLRFPDIPPQMDYLKVYGMAEYRAKEIIKNYPPETVCFVLVQGEFAYTFHLANRLREYGYICGCATSERSVTANADGTKTVKFEFVQFRKY